MYTADFKKRNEREVVEAARAVLGLSKSQFTKTVLIKESVSILQQAQRLTKAAQEKAELEGETSGGEISTMESAGIAAEESPSEAVHSSVPADTETVAAE